jgi:hypothetical protein
VIENLKFRVVKKPMTLGIMQVISDRIINDAESIRYGVEKLNKTLSSFIESKGTNLSPDHEDWEILAHLIKEYNGGRSYNSEVSELFGIILDKFYDNQRQNHEFTDMPKDDNN